jgi:hypothetical protein
MAKSEKWYCAIKKANTKHGYSKKERLYSTWCHLRQRCTNPNDRAYKRYGGRGIKVCQEWNNYISFREWALENGYADNLTIDRIDNNGDYCPENCRWVNMKIQCNNRQSNHFITCRGETHTLSEWSDIVGLQSLTILARIRKGWDEESAVFLPKGARYKNGA